MLPARGIWGLLARVMGNSYRDTFTVRLGSTLLLAKFGIVGPVADLLSVFVRGFIGLLMETTVFQIDLAIDSLREGMKLAEFEKEANKVYAKATAKIYDEDKKNEIRKEYLRIIARMGAVGNGPRKP